MLLLMPPGRTPKMSSEPRDSMVLCTRVGRGRLWAPKLFVRVKPGCVKVPLLLLPTWKEVVEEEEEEEEPGEGGEVDRSEDECEVRKPLSEAGSVIPQLCKIGSRK